MILYKDVFRNVFENNYWKSLTGSILLFVVFYKLPYQQFFIAANLCAVFFAIIVVLTTIKIRIENRHLCWLGKNLFPIYIYQRIPMIALLAVADGWFVAEHQYLYVVISFLITLGLGYAYKHIMLTEQNIPSLKFNKAS